MAKSRYHNFMILALAIIGVILISGCVEQTPSGPTVSGEGYALLWSRQVGSQVWGVSVSSDGNYVAVKDSSTLYFYDKEGRLLWSHGWSEFGPGTRFTPPLVSSDGSYVAAGDFLFDRGGKLLWQQTPPHTDVSNDVIYRYTHHATDVSISSDGSYTAVGRGGSSTSTPTPESIGRHVYLYDKNGNLLWNYTTTTEDGSIKDVAISSDGNYVAACSGDGYVYFFDREGKLLWSYKTGEAICAWGGGVSVSPNGSYAAVGAYDDNVYRGYVYLFNRDGKLLWDYNANRTSINKVLASSDGSYVAAMDGSGYVYLFNRDGKLLWRGAEVCEGVGPLSRCGGVANSISVSSDALYIAVGGRDGKVHVYNRKGELIFSSEAEKNAVNPFMNDGISISSDGNYVAAGTSISSGGSYAGKIYFFGKGAAQENITAGVGTNISEAVGREVVSEPGWMTHTYENRQMGYAFSFDTPADWNYTGPIGERGVGGMYDPSYPKPPSTEAVWCYWITAGMPGGETLPPLGDPITITSTQKKVSTAKVKGDWAYHLMCVSPVEVFDQKAQILEKILESLKSLS